MKKLILLSLVLSISNNVFAHGGFQVNGAEVITLSTVAPFISSFQCMKRPDVESCSAATSTTTVVALSSVLLLKEDIKAVEGDSYNFIAGEPMTQALAEQIAQVRKAANGELDEASDEEIIVLMLEIAKA